MGVAGCIANVLQKCAGGGGGGVALSWRAVAGAPVAAGDGQMQLNQAVLAATDLSGKTWTDAEIQAALPAGTDTIVLTWPGGTIKFDAVSIPSAGGNSGKVVLTTDGMISTKPAVGDVFVLSRAPAP
jgi:hypothetical protein